MIERNTQITAKAQVLPGKQQGCWRLEIPSGPKGRYRLAQLDDYALMSRNSFPHTYPLELSLRARVSTNQIPGTWGFGFWNDPFSVSIKLGGGARRFPALPNAVWFFSASKQSYLSFQDNLPANGFISQTFRSNHLPAPILAVASPLLPIFFIPRAAQKLRSILRGWIKEDSLAWDVDITEWHNYSLTWQVDKVRFCVDHHTFETKVSPRSPLGLVIWIDNQFAALPPHGKLRFGTIENPQPAWLEIENLSLYKG